MALEATHIRFAVDLMDEYSVKEVGLYISGTLYPDSRNMTKTERNLTHDQKYLAGEFANNDFKKGWQVHLLCDEIQTKYIRNIINTHGEIIQQNNNAWIEHTAVKVLQEIEDLKSFDVSKYLQYSQLSFVPHNESREVLDSYYGFIKNFYSEGSIKIENYRVMFDFFGFPKDVENEVIAKCVSLQQDEVKMRKIKDMYSKMIAEAKCKM